MREESGAVHVEGGEGLFFMSPGDAKANLNGLKGVGGVKVKVGMNLCRPGRLGTHRRMCTDETFCVLSIF